MCKPPLAQATLQVRKPFHWRKGVALVKCVGYPCALLALQIKYALTKHCQFNNAIIFCIVFCTAVNPLFCFVNKSAYYRVLMNVKYNLCIHFLSCYFNGLIMLLPELPVAVIAILLTCSFHNPYNPFLSAFLRMFFYYFFNTDEVWLFISLTMSSNGLSLLLIIM
jgi:hypothetical protein